MEEIYQIMVENGQGDLVDYTMIESDYGHDAFLVELDKFDFMIKETLENNF
jgi:homoserine O-acetyltransferase